MDPTGHPFPMTVGNPSSLMARASALWRHLPAPVAGFLGARLRRYLSN
jgi:hypothetical protein